MWPNLTAVIFEKRNQQISEKFKHLAMPENLIHTINVRPGGNNMCATFTDLADFNCPKIFFCSNFSQ